ncbi:MAG: flagellar basal body-associated FliL family protein [Deltaproteobacteria bacterium]|nr:flagellar basal body-associated FliL family protein [Deltaproteobacteria bacterium]MBI3295020.1 flagellar basal body-associated FliL family protein [Deltaproteobacteria bacterium]
MAEAAKKEKNAVTPAPAPGAAPKKDFISLILLSLVTVNLIALGGMGVFMQKMWGRIHEVSEVAKKAAEAQPVENGAPKGLGKEVEAHKMGPLFPVDNILVNINSDQGPKFLQIQMELELTDPAVEEELKKKKPIVRDAILVLLSSRSYRELRESDGMTKLRADLMRSINTLLSAGRVKEIYFTQYHFN